jgi:hypothetical protein
MTDSIHLNNHHRETLKKIFSHPTNHNIEWVKAESLLASVGTVHGEHNGHVKITVGERNETLHRPRHKDIDPEMVVLLRKMLTEAGITPDTIEKSGK